MAIKHKLSILGFMTIIVIFLTGGVTYYLNEVLIDIINDYKYQTGQLEQLFRLNTSVLKVSETYNNAIVLTMMGEDGRTITKSMHDTMIEHDAIVSDLRSLDKKEITLTLGKIDDLAKAVYKGFDIISSGDSYGASEYFMASLKAPVENVKAEIASLIKAEQDNIKNIEIDYDNSLARYKRNRNLTLGGIVILLLSLCTFTFVLFRSITKAISNTVEDLTHASDLVASASGQVSASSQSLAEGASQQAASLEETSSSLNEMSSMTKQNADNATEVNNLMKDANQVIARANESMNELTVSMGDISKASEETYKIIKTIDEIAFQTNLLALNAAVEAARAGEAGAGFAVVADEVRSLAMRAADAARDTSRLIEDTVKKIKEGTETVAKTNDDFGEVALKASKVGDLVGEIAAASGEQAQGIEQVNRAVAEMDKLTLHNAESAEESASASEEMSTQADQMKEVVDTLKKVVGGGGRKGSEIRSTGVGKPHASHTEKARGIKGHPGSGTRAHVPEPDSEKLILLDEEVRREF